MGHVGTVVAGIITGFTVLILGGLALVCLSKVEAIKNAGTDLGNRG